MSLISSKYLFGIMALTLGPLLATAQKTIIYQDFVRLFGNDNTVRKPYGSIEENGSGKFNDMSDKCLDALRTLHVDYIWYTGVIAHASTTAYPNVGITADDADIVKGRAGSPYSIRDYYDVDPDLAVVPANSMAEFDALVARTHRKGIKVLIDFIPNHLSRAYKKSNDKNNFGAQDDTTKAFSPTNDFYYIPDTKLVVPKNRVYDSAVTFLPSLDGKFAESPAKATGNNVFSNMPSVDDWYETIKLNYGIDYQHDNTKHFTPIPPLWTKMKNVLLYWASKNIDGFRCDMVEMVPNEFWAWVIPQVKAAFPKIIFIGEAYNPSLYKAYWNAGFNYLYDKVGLYDALKSFYTGNGSIRAIDSLAMIDNQSNMIRFLENHDEVRIHSKDFTEQPIDALAAMTITATMGNSPIMLYAGQEVGQAARGAEGFGGDDSRSSLFDYWSLNRVQEWRNKGTFDGKDLPDSLQLLRKQYVNLLSVVKKNKALTNGTYQLVYADTSNHVLGYLRKDKTSTILVMNNLDKAKTQAIHFDKNHIALPKKMTILFASKQNISAKLASSKLLIDLPPMSSVIIRL